jgi:hypothetical protein
VSTRLLIYARGTPEEIADQRAECLLRVGRGEAVVSVASDPPDGSAGWISANAMFARGEVDRIMVASRRVIPTIVESLTQQLPGRRPRRRHRLT